MNAQAIRFFFVATLLCIICAGCASIVPPSGGPKDVTPPKLLSVTPPDSSLNTRISHIKLQFDEYITVSNASKEVEISPILEIAPTVTGLNKHVIVHIADSLLEDSTTYRISFGSAVRDLHEGNPFLHYTYTFSTGSYFDSLEVNGKVLNAMTGLPDTGIYVLLYSASKSDSAVARQKPKYAIKADADGSFSLKGLPAKKFRIYALKDANGNLIYDGIGEMIGFYDKIIVPGKAGDSANPPITLRVFPEAIDTNLKKKTDTTAARNEHKIGAPESPRPVRRKEREREKEKQKQKLAYVVNLDTSNVAKRTHDITLPIGIAFGKIPVITPRRISLNYDSSGVAVETVITDSVDTVNKKMLYIKPAHWRENTVYTLRLQKGFAKDTGGMDFMPSRYTFRTYRDEDYGILHIHLPPKYYGRQYLLMVMADKDTIYQKPVTDTMVTLTYLRPADYTFRIIVDKNENGKWDTGNLFEKKQPEEVIPYIGSQPLKAGWEDTVDFETTPSAPKKGATQSTHPPPK